MALTRDPALFLSPIGPDDRHHHFVYFVACESFEHDWITEWFAAQFGMIAEQFGPNAIFITSTRPLGPDLVDPLRDLYRCHSGRGEFGRTPHLLITRRPIDLADESFRSPESREFATVDLSVVRNGAELGRLIDLLLDAGLNGEKSMIDKIAEIERSFTRGDGLLAGVNQSLELKPNIMGLGLNVNGLISHLTVKLAARRSRRHTS